MNCPKCGSDKIKDYRCGICSYAFQEGDKLSADGSITYTEYRWSQVMGEVIDLMDYPEIKEAELKLLKAKIEATEKRPHENLTVSPCRFDYLPLDAPYPHTIQGTLPPEPIIYKEGQDE